MYHAKGEEILYVPYRVQQPGAGMKSRTQKLLSTASFSVNSLFFFFTTKWAFLQYKMQGQDFSFSLLYKWLIQ